MKPGPQTGQRENKKNNEKAVQMQIDLEYTLKHPPGGTASTHGDSLCHCERTGLNHLKATTRTDRDHLPSNMQCKERIDLEVIVKVPRETLASLLTELHSVVQNVDQRE